MKRSNGLNFAEVLLLVFIVLKLLGVISWSWLWVLSPIWISVILFLVGVLLIGLGYFIEGMKGD